MTRQRRTWLIIQHSIKDIPHPLAFALPITHTGVNPPFEFLIRHPTPHASRHDLYVAQPLCSRLAVNNTFVFAIRQHPSTVPTFSVLGQTSPAPSRPSSAMSTTSSVAGASGVSTERPAKLSIQSPSGKILRLMRKGEHSMIGGSSGKQVGDGSIWESIIKVSERGTWRGLVLADRSARWCVFAEWECV